jgi:acyl-CoA oxidase
MKCVSHYTLDAYYTCMSEVKRGDWSTIAEIHGNSTGLKAFCTEIASAGVEECRKRCGGHGFSKASGFPNLFACVTASTAVEGDNVVLYLQTARFLIKHFAQAQMGDELPSSVAYLKDKTLLSQPDWYLKDVQLKVYGERAKYATMQASLRLQSLVNEGWQQSDAWNACSVQLVACAQVHR